MTNRFVKYYHLHQTQWPRVKDRLVNTLTVQPRGVLLPLQWGLITSHNRSLCTLQIIWPHLKGMNLSHYIKTHFGHVTFLRDEFLTLFSQWQAAGFVHGDLSPCNLFITTTKTLLTYDWLLDLDRPSGTPLFASSRILNEGHNLETDQESAQKLLQWINYQELKSIQGGSFPTTPLSQVKC